MQKESQGQRLIQQANLQPSWPGLPGLPEGWTKAWIAWTKAWTVWTDGQAPGRLVRGRARWKNCRRRQRDRLQLKPLQLR